MPVILPDGETVPVHDERAQRLLRLRLPLRITCTGCNPTAVNGKHLIHERGCPDEYVDATLVCPWCGTQFHPTDRSQTFCTDGCHRAYAGLPDPDEDDATSPDL